MKTSVNKNQTFCVSSETLAAKAATSVNSTEAAHCDELVNFDVNNKRHREAADMYALGCIDIKDVEYLIGTTPAHSKEFKEYCNQYALQYERYLRKKYPFEYLCYLLGIRKIWAINFLKITGIILAIGIVGLIIIIL